MKRFIVLALAIALVLPCMSMAAEQELLITTYGHDFTVSGNISSSADDAGVITYTPTVTLRDMAAGKSIKAWTDPLPADVATMTLTDVAGGVSTFRGAGTTVLKTAILTMMQQTFKVAGVVEAGSKLARVSFGGVNLYNSDDGTTVTSPGVPSAITWP